MNGIILIIGIFNFNGRMPHFIPNVMLKVLFITIILIFLNLWGIIKLIYNFNFQLTEYIENTFVKN